MVNFNINLTFFIGIVYVLLGIAYFIAMLVLIGRQRRNTTSNINIWQTIFVPIVLLTSGIILYQYGWRLDPILQLVQLLLSILIVYLVVKDLRNSTI